MFSSRFVPTLGRGAASALLVLLAGSVSAIAAPTTQQQHTAAVAKLVAAAQHHASLTPYLTTEGATLQIVKHQWHGVKAINTWFKGQYRQNLKVSLLTLVSVQGGTARAMIRWITGTGKTLQVTQQQAVWRFSGARIQKITLDPVKVPVPAGPPSSVPTPPSGSPPHVTPTIPS